ncbi:MAG: DNA-processing protein DprA [Ruminococcus sp.]|nr:DNA-processing protein DprA [Ruminococcus sp.]
MISSNAKYWIWISLALGFNNPKVGSLNKLYDDITFFYSKGEREWRFCGILSDKDINRLSKTKLESAERVIKRCNQLGYSVLAIDDEKFPKSLLNIYAPPAVIYIEGNLPDIDNRLSIGIVGTRRATKYGLDNSYKIGYALSKYGVTIVSGGALGVDCASHRGSLAADGVTVCVRGCGINCEYLKKNAEMRRAITKRGAVISEYPPDEEPKKYYFPARNRIISALSDGVLIIEAGKISGSLITANLALEQGKEVFALMGNNSPQNEGSNNRIKEGSAIPVTDFMDILNAFDNLYATDESVDFDNISIEDIEAIPVKGKSPSMNKPKTFKNINKDKNTIENIIDNSDREIKHRTDLDLNPTAQRVYDYISNEPVHIDDMVSDLNIPVYKVLVALTELEIKHAVKALQGRRYILN